MFTTMKVCVCDMSSFFLLLLLQFGLEFTPRGGREEIYIYIYVVSNTKKAIIKSASRVLRCPVVRTPHRQQNAHTHSQRGKKKHTRRRRRTSYARAHLVIFVSYFLHWSDKKSSTLIKRTQNSPHILFARTHTTLRAPRFVYSIRVVVVVVVFVTTTTLFTLKEDGRRRKCVVVVVHDASKARTFRRRRHGPTLTREKQKRRFGRRVSNDQTVVPPRVFEETPG